MKRSLLIIPLALVTVAGAQTHAPVARAQASTSLPQTLPELVGILPALVHNKQLQFAPYSDAVWAALQKDPASATAAIPILSRNLRDPDQDVQSYTLAILQSLALVRRDYAELVSPLSGQLANAIATGNEKTKTSALLTVEQFHQKAPEDVIPPIENLLVSRPKSDRLVLGAAETLMATRPTDNTAQELVLAAINDPSLPTRLRQGLIRAASDFGVGSKVRDEVVQLANTSEDKSWRDAAIAGAERIGPEALTRISDVLKEIANDPTESLASQQLAHQGLDALARIAR